MTREEAKEFLKEIANDLGYTGIEEYGGKDREKMFEAIEVLEQEPKQGHWKTEKMGTFGKFYRCSNCNELYHTKTTYCPFCGSYNGG